MHNYDADPKKHPVIDSIPDYDYVNAASPMDCTGSVPRPPQTSAELESYLDTYNFLPQSAFTKPNDVTIDMLEAQMPKNTSETL